MLEGPGCDQAWASAVALRGALDEQARGLCERANGNPDTVRTLVGEDRYRRLAERAGIPAPALDAEAWEPVIREELLMSRDLARAVRRVSARVRALAT